MMIELSKEEQIIAKMLARKRYRNARKKGIPDKKIGKQDNWFTDLNGVGAEMAFCKRFNYYPDLQITEIPDFDAISHKGKTIDVKTTKYKSGKLVAAKWKTNKNPADIYVLMVGEFPRYEFKGYATKEELFKEENLKDLGHGKGYALNQNQLKKL